MQGVESIGERRRRGMDEDQTHFATTPEQRPRCEENG